MDAAWQSSTWGVVATNIWPASAAKPALSAVTRNRNSLDVLYVDANGPEDAFFNNGWGVSSTGVSGGWLTSGAPIAGVARTANNLDLFEVVWEGATPFPISEHWSTGNSWGVVSPL